MRIVVKGLNYTEIRYSRKDSPKQTVIHYKLAKERLPKDCGVWRDGKQIMDYDCMEEA